MSSELKATLNCDWLRPNWPAPPNVHALCTTRAGGQSLAPYATLNLGQHVGDKASDVAANRAILQQQIGAQPVFLSQLHGTQVVRLSAQTENAIQADACMTDQTGIACTVMVADCLPVLLTNRQGSVVAAAHAGWRGLAGFEGRGILEAVVQAFTESALMAWLGPCIGPQSFEVGDEVREVFIANDPVANTMFTPISHGKWLGNLQGLARLRLQALGVHQIDGNDGGPDWCTFSNPSRFFSHRRDRISGRMAACIWIG